MVRARAAVRHYCRSVTEYDANAVTSKTRIFLCNTLKLFYVFICSVTHLLRADCILTSHTQPLSLNLHRASKQRPVESERNRKPYSVLNRATRNVALCSFWKLLCNWLKGTVKLQIPWCPLHALPSIPDDSSFHSYQLDFLKSLFCCLFLAHNVDNSIDSLI